MSRVAYGVRVSIFWGAAVEYRTVQYCTVQYSAVQYSTVQCSAVQCSAVQRSAVGGSPNPLRTPRGKIDDEKKNDYGEGQRVVGGMTQWFVSEYNASSREGPWTT